MIYQHKNASQKRNHQIFRQTFALNSAVLSCGMHFIAMQIEIKHRFQLIAQC